MRKSTVWSATAEPVYSRRPSSGTFSTPKVVVGQPDIPDGAEISPAVLRSDAVGALYILYNPIGRGLSLLKRTGVAGGWTEPFSPRFSDLTSSSDLAVGADGGYAFTIPSIRDGA